MSRLDPSSADVLMLAWEYPPRIVGGLAVHVAGLSRALARRGVRVTVLTPGGYGRPSMREDAGVRIVLLGRNPFGRLPMLEATREMNASFLVLANTYAGPGTIVHAHDWMTASAACALQRHRGFPLLATFHSTERGRSSHLFRKPTPDRSIESLERRLYRSAHRRITPSVSMRKELEASYGPQPTSVVANGVDVPLRVPRARSVEGRILFVGRLVREKGVWFLVQALAALCASRPQAHLVIVGAGPELSPLRREVRRLQLEDRVAFLGQLPPDEVARQREEASVVVVPSLYEPFGIVALEAMAWGVPLVASAVGGLQEFTEGAALLVPPGDPDALTAALHRLLSDDGLQRDLSRKGMDRVSQYSWDAAAERTASVYGELLRERASAAALDA